jgi:hypothetical protein
MTHANPSTTTGGTRTVALAGVPAGLQSRGIWAGHRQIFVRFATEAETATMYTAPALARELSRQSARPGFHSICIGGRDPLGSDAFLIDALGQTTTGLPVMIDTDGQRPQVIAGLAQWIAIVQVSLDFMESDAEVERALETIGATFHAGRDQALVLEPRDETPDAQIIRVVERLHRISERAKIVLHPAPAAERAPALDRRWAMLMEQCAALHPAIRLGLRIPGPAAIR